MFKEFQIAEKALELTKSLMKLSLKEWVESGQIKDIVRSLDLRNHDSQMYFLTGLGVVIRRYPDAIFSTPDVRMKLLQAIQEYLDEIILEENS